MQQTPWDFIPWRFVLLILAHISEIFKNVISGKYGNFFLRWRLRAARDGNREVPTPEPQSPAPSIRRQRTEGLRDYLAAAGLRQDKGRETKDYQKTIFRLAGDGGKFFTARYRITDAMAENAFSVLI